MQAICFLCIMDYIVKLCELSMTKELFAKKLPFLLLLFLLIGGILIFAYSLTQRTDKNDKARHQELEEQTTYKGIEIGKPTLLYDGTKLTVYDIQIYEPAQISRSRSDSNKYIAVALDIEVNKEINKIRAYNPLTKSINLLTDKSSIDRYYAEDIFDINNNAYNPHSMKWAMQELEYELRLLFTDKTITRLDPYFVRLAFDKESAQPRIFRVWNDYEKRRNISVSYVDAPRKIKGWVTWIFKVDEAFKTDKIDYSFGEGLVIKYKNSTGNIEELLKELGKIPKEK